MSSLSAGLLARPGQAKPAMRPQAFSYGQIEDLGWNDMGHGAPPPAPVATPLPAESAIAAVAPPALAPSPEPAPAPAKVRQAAVPPVLSERADLARAIARAPASKGPRAAFTLRLDPARHLRLRLASAVEGRSAQQVVAAALDAFLSERPQVEALAQQVATDQDRLSGGKTR